MLSGPASLSDLSLYKLMAVPMQAPLLNRRAAACAGAKATELMWRLKALFDPHNILNPGVILSKVHFLKRDF